MTWFAVDDSFHGHPKLAALEDGPCFAQAVALWTVAGSWCAHHLTDGAVPSAQLRKLVPYPTSKAASELVRVGLWSETDGGYQFNDWDHYQPTREEVEEKRMKGAARTRKSRAMQRARNASCNAVTPSVTNGERNASVTLPRPDPTRSQSVSPNGETIAHVRAHDPEPPRVEHGDVVALFARLRAEAHQAKHGRPGGTYRRGPRDWQPVEDLCAWASEQPEPMAALEDSLRGYLSDEWATGAGWPVSAWAKDPGRYCGRFLAREGVQKATDEEKRLQVALRDLRARYDAARGTDDHPRILQEIVATREMLRVCRQQMEGAA